MQIEDDSQHLESCRGMVGYALEVLGLGFLNWL